MRRRLLYRTRRQNNRIRNNRSKQPPCDIFLITSERLRLMRWSHRCFQAWDTLALLQWLTKLNDERQQSAWIFSWQPPPQQLFRFRDIFWTRDAATILMDDSLTNIDLIYDFALALNASIEQQMPESALRWWNHWSPATQQIFIFFFCRNPEMRCLNIDRSHT